MLPNASILAIGNVKAKRNARHPVDPIGPPTPLRIKLLLVMATSLGNPPATEINRANLTSPPNRLPPPLLLNPIRLRRQNQSLTPINSTRMARLRLPSASDV